MTTTTVSARPSKEFFISMLTRDISLINSIVDLIDNSVDAANRSGNVGDKFVKINLSKNGVRLEDNCGGISREAAKYAFRFGRPDDAPPSPLSIGRFGVGMKRALFKMGAAFSVISHHEDESFEVKVDVDTWLRLEGEWLFDVTSIDPEGNFGTTILVEALHPAVADNFENEPFIKRLKEAIERAHFLVLRQGFSVDVNGEKIGLKDITVVKSKEISISSRAFQLESVSVSVKAGVGARDYHAGGWNVLCNGRLVEVANKGALTGWGDSIRNYHPDFAFFRGVVEFTSEDGNLLPWNTTKTGVDSDNLFYRTTLVEMKNVMRPVLTLLQELVKEKENNDSGVIDETPINDAISNATMSSIFDINDFTPFVRPQFVEAKREVIRGRVAYLVPIEDLEKVKDALGARSNKEVGELTFEYYMDNEL